MTAPDKLLRLPDIIRPEGLLPISRSTFLTGVKAKRFPAPIRLGPNTVAWKASEIHAVMETGV